MKEFHNKGKATHWNVYRQNGQGTAVNSSSENLKNNFEPRKFNELNFVNKFRKTQANGSAAIQPMIYDKNDSMQLTL